MRKFTKSFLALALLFMGVSNASAGETTIMVRDYTQTDSYPYWWMGDRVNDEPNQPYFCGGTATVQIVNGALVIDNTQEQTNNWDLQPFIIDWFNMQVGYGYKIVITMKSNVDGAANLSVGTWSAQDNVGLNFTATNDFAEYTATIASGSVAADQSNAHVLFQMGKVVGTVEIQKVEVIEVEPDVPPTFTDIITNGDLEGDENVNFTVKEQGVGGPFMAKIEDGVGVGGSRGIKVQSSDNPSQDWDTQFFISVPKKLATGTRYKVSFDYKASQDANGGAQWHNEPGGYVHWNSIGNQSFTTDWKTYEKTGTVGKGDEDADIAPYTVAFNLAITKTATTYYFDNIKFEVRDDDLGNLEDAPALTSNPAPTFTIGESGYATFGSPYPVIFDESVEVYTAVLNDEGCLTLTQTNAVPAYTGVIIKGAPGYYAAQIQIPAPVAPTENYLEVSDGHVQGDGYVYALADKDKGVGFYKVADGETVPYGKAYLVVVASAPDFLGFDGNETTSISELNVKNDAEGVYYNIAGQRVAQPTKGLYIVNGKKVIK